MSFTAAAVLLADAWGVHHDDVGLGWGLLMTLAMLLFWGLVIYVVVQLARGAYRDGARGDGEGPQEILKRRLAAGDISVEEYERRRALLEDTKPPPGEAAARDGT